MKSLLVALAEAKVLLLERQVTHSWPQAQLVIKVALVVEESPEQAVELGAKESEEMKPGR